MIRHWLRWLKFKSQGERAVAAVFDSAPETTEVIHLEEVGLPSGGTTTIQWLCTRNSAKSRISIRSNRSDELLWHEVERETSDFRTLIESIRKLDAPPIENFSAPVRDGGYYYIAWGSRANVRSVNFRIPLKDDARQRLVAVIKSSVAEQQITATATNDMAEGEH